MDIGPLLDMPTPATGGFVLKEATQVDMRNEDMAVWWIYRGVIIQPARGGLFTDLTIYLYGGTSANLSKIPSLLGESLFAFAGKNDQYKKVGD